MINILKKIGWFIKAEKKRYFGMLALLLFIAFISLLPAKMLGLAIDTIVSGGLTVKSLMYLVGGLVLLPVIRYFCSYGYNYLMTAEAENCRSNCVPNIWTIYFRWTPSSMSNTPRGI